MKATMKMTYEALSDLLGLHQHAITVEKVTGNDAQGMITLTVETALVVPTGQRLSGTYKSHAVLSDIKMIDDK